MGDGPSPHGIAGRIASALRPRWVRTLVGVVSLFAIPPIVPLLGLPETYGKAQTSRAGGLVDVACEGDGGGGLRCVRADEIRRGTRRDDWWVLGYGLLGSVAALSLTSLRSRADPPTPGRRGLLAVALLLAGGAFDLVENAQLRQSVSALSRGGRFDSREAAVAAVGGHADATVLMGRFKTGFLALALVVVIWSLVRAPRPRS